jgi:hypothetical protein
MSTSAKRKQAQREREKTFEIKRVEVPLSATERKMLAEGCEFRGGYTASEYIATLIRRDYERIQETKKTLGDCQYCNDPLPQGCQRKHKGHKDCFHTIEARKLSL